VYSGATPFRVFLLINTLQVDLAFWPPADFGAIAPTFRLLFGTANDRPPTPAPAAVELIGKGWLFALHARSSIARGRLWQAEYMVSAMRDQVLSLACLRYCLPAVQGRGVDNLPPEITEPVHAAIVRRLDVAELRRAFAATSAALLVEIEWVDGALASRLAGPLRELVNEQ